jgi:hypothetical protein
VDFDYLNQFGTTLQAPENDTRNSVLLKFDPLLKKPVQVTTHQVSEKLPITKEEEDFEGLTLKIETEPEIKQEKISLEPIDNVKMKDFIVPEKNESNHLDCQDIKLRCVIILFQGHFCNLFMIGFFSSHDQSDTERKMADLEEKIKSEV